jgi:hypothetical protein
LKEVQRKMQLPCRQERIKAERERMYVEERNPRKFEIWS